MNKRTTAAWAFWALACGSALARAEPATTGSYACHVRIAGDKPAIVLVETASRERAAQMAGRATARAADGTRARVQAVLRCIDRRREHFAEPQAAQLLEQHGL